MQQYDFLALRSFIAVIETGNFSRAAELLNASTAAISRRVSGLESSLGVKLLNRTTRQLDLTEAGQQFYLDIKNIFDSLEEAEERIQKDRNVVRGVLKVGAPLSFGIQRLAPYLPVFMNRHPDLKVLLHLEDRYTDLISESIDISVRIGNLKDSSLVATKISTIPKVFCASPEYIKRCGNPKEPADLMHHNCLHYNLISEKEEWSFSNGNETQIIAVNGTLSTNNGEVLRSAAIQGTGITLLPTFLVEEAIKDGTLIVILDQYKPEPIGLYAVRPSRQFTPAKVKLFIEFLKNSFEGGDTLAYGPKR